MSRLTIYFGRITWEAEHPDQVAMFEREPILDAIQRAESVERYGHQWVLGNITVDTERHLVLGRLGYPETEVRSQQDYELAEHRFVDRQYELPDAVSGAFALNYRSGALAFEGDQIGPTGFVNHLVALLNTVADDGQFKGLLDRLAATYRDFLRSVDKVRRVSFEVRPTNPKDRAIFRPLDEGMKAANAMRQRVTVENKEEGLVLDPPDSPDESTANPAIQGIEMNEEGYGEGFKIDAEKDGQMVRYDSVGGGSLLTEVVPDAPDDPEQRAHLVEQVFEAHGEEPPTPPPSAFSISDADLPADLDEQKPRGELEPPSEDD
jgi:hypothetical protein